MTTAATTTTQRTAPTTTTTLTTASTRRNMQSINSVTSTSTTTTRGTGTGTGTGSGIGTAATKQTTVERKLQNRRRRNAKMYFYGRFSLLKSIIRAKKEIGNVNRVDDDYDSDNNSIDNDDKADAHDPDAKVLHNQDDAKKPISRLVTETTSNSLIELPTTTATTPTTTTTTSQTDILTMPTTATTATTTTVATRPAPRTQLPPTPSQPVGICLICRRVLAPGDCCCSCCSSYRHVVQCVQDVNETTTKHTRRRPSGRTVANHALYSCDDVHHNEDDDRSRDDDDDDSGNGNGNGNNGSYKQTTTTTAAAAAAAAATTTQTYYGAQDYSNNNINNNNNNNNNNNVSNNMKEARCLVYCTQAAAPTTTATATTSRRSHERRAKVAATFLTKPDRCQSENTNNNNNNATDCVCICHSQQQKREEQQQQQQQPEPQQQQRLLQHKNQPQQQQQQQQDEQQTPAHAACNSTNDNNQIVTNATTATTTTNNRSSSSSTSSRRRSKTTTTTTAAAPPSPPPPITIAASTYNASTNNNNNNNNRHKYLNIMSIIRFLMVFIQLQVLPYCCNIFKRQQQQEQQEEKQQYQAPHQLGDNMNFLLQNVAGLSTSTTTTTTSTTTRLSLSRNNYYNCKQLLQQHHKYLSLSQQPQPQQQQQQQTTTANNCATFAIETTTTTNTTASRSAHNALQAKQQQQQQQPSQHHEHCNCLKQQQEPQQHQQDEVGAVAALQHKQRHEQHYSSEMQLKKRHFQQQTHSAPLHQNRQPQLRQQHQHQQQKMPNFIPSILWQLLFVLSFLTFLTALPTINAQIIRTRTATTDTKIDITTLHQNVFDDESHFADAFATLTNASPLAAAASSIVKRSAAPTSNVIGSQMQMRLSRNETVCKSMDIRNEVKSFRQLENCTAIEGFLLISLINVQGLTESYPLLTEVTDFIIVYRVNGLKSLSQIFPNLRVIRGGSLFDGYALVVYSNRDLENIGLSNLRAIGNGGVRIEKNLFLCYLTTVNWKHIVSSNASDIVLNGNRVPKECPKCPGDHQSGLGNNEGDLADALTCKEYPGRLRYCWSKSACQTICPERCRTNCIDENTCCDDACLGGCIMEDNKQECTSCRHYSIHNDTCIEKCPKDYYAYADRRCITAEACERIGTKFENTKDVPLVHYNGQCTTRCPKGYTKLNATCQKCSGQCEKICEGGIIDSFVRAKEFTGCTQIGSRGLTISVKRGGPHLMEALEQGLGAIHTIRTHLKLHLNIGLFSLSFFKSLKEIRGEELLEGRYSLYVLENSDLESLWGPNRTVKLLKGSVFFHFNSKLCYSVIDSLRPMMQGNLTEFNKNEVATDSNGNKGSCNTRVLYTSITGVATTVVFVRIENPMRYDDERTFIGYQYFIIEDPYRNATRHSYRPCDDNWIASDPTKETNYMFTGLTSYKNYAFYVRTKTISSEPLNGQSEIGHFRTNPSKPDYVRQLKAFANSSSEIILSWMPPVNAFGNLTTYVVRAVLYNRNDQLEQRNYCKDPLKETYINEEDSAAFRPTSDKADKSAKPSDCKCENENEKSTSPVFDPENDALRQDEIEFENTLQNFVYVKDTNRTINPNVAAVAAVAARLHFGNDSAGGSGGLRTKDDGKLKKRRRSLDYDERATADESSFLVRHMRSLGKDPPDGSDWNTSSMAKWPPNKLDPKTWLNETRMSASGAYYEVYVATVNASTTEYHFSKLRHFSMYTLAIVACREKIAKEKEETCSEVMLLDKITLKLDNVDRVENLKGNLVATNSTRGSVRLDWKPPQSPNGAIVSYTISYEKQDPDAVEERKCITELDFQNLTDGYLLPGLPEGNYSIRVRANSLAGEGIYTERIYIEVPPVQMSGGVIAAIVIGVFILLCVPLAFIGYFLRKKGTPSDLTMFPTVNPFYISLQYIPDEWEVPRDRVLQLNPLGQGSFGMVYEGLLKGYHNTTEDTPCAIKTVNENATDRERMNFLNEASVMKQFDTYHVVRLLGVCSRGQPALVVMELMKNGDLKSYLRAHRSDERDDVLASYQQRTGNVDSMIKPPPLSRIYQMAIEIADGMAYLAAKKFVHRDLAARNCMVAADLTVKIGDFGMTRDIYETDYYRKGTKGLLPVRWMPPESLRDGVYASSSDVFSYGVVLWEMVTLASQPYQGLSNDQVLRYVIDGGVMERPENCPDRIYTLMHSCWHHRPSARPTFPEIINMLLDTADPQFCDVSYFHTEDGQMLLGKVMAERYQHGGDSYQDREHELDDATTPLRVGEYHGYKSNMEPNSSVEPQEGESPFVPGARGGEGEQRTSPFSLHSAFIVSSTPDRQSKNSLSLSHNPNQILGSASVTSATGVGGIAGSNQAIKSYFGRIATRSQCEDDAAAYVLPDNDAQTHPGTDDRGYEIYDPSPDYQKMSIFDAKHEIAELPSGGKLSGEQHLLPRTKSQGRQAMPSILPMSSSMPDDVINAPMSSSLHPSTASAASSNASSATGTTGRYPSLKRAVADSLMPARLRNMNRHFFNHKRSGSNTSHRSTSSNPNTGIGSGGGVGGSNSNTNLTSGGGAGYSKSMSGQNLGTIESGGSAGSYVSTPRFFSPMTQNSSGVSTTADSDNTESYKLLDESADISGFSTTTLVPTTMATSSTRTPASSTATATTNPTSPAGAGSSYKLLNESLNTTNVATSPLDTLNVSVNPNYEIMLPHAAHSLFPPINTSVNPNYVVMNEPKKRTISTPSIGSHSLLRPLGPSTAALASSSSAAAAAAAAAAVAAPTPTTSNLSALSTITAALRREQSAERLDNSSTSTSASSSDDEPDDMDDDIHTEHIKMERMPLSHKARAQMRGKSTSAAAAAAAAASKQRSRSVSQSRKNDQTTPSPPMATSTVTTATPASATATPTTTTATSSTTAEQQQQQQQQQPQQDEQQQRQQQLSRQPSNTFSLKENWLRQQQPPRPPPPNGFIGREA